MFESTVLGIDPGVAKMGLAVVARSGSSCELVWADTVVTAPDAFEDEAARLLFLAQEVRRVLRQHGPQAVAIERVAFKRNAVSALNVARATGAAMVVAASAGLLVAEYAPAEIKMAVTGDGSAEKSQVRDALARIHGLKDVPTKADAADAVAVGLTHLYASRLPRSSGRAHISAMVR